MEQAELETLSLDELRSRWQSLEDSLAPNLPVALLRKLYAQRVREHAYGGIPDWVLAEFDRVLAEHRRPKTEKRVVRARSSLSVGTRLVREWNGKTISVEVSEHGYYYGCRLYGSLSEIAREVTGTRWSGPRFFGIARHG